MKLINDRLKNGHTKSEKESLSLNLKKVNSYPGQVVLCLVNSLWWKSIRLSHEENIFKKTKSNLTKSKKVKKYFCFIIVVLFLSRKVKHLLQLNGLHQLLIKNTRNVHSRIEKTHWILFSNYTRNDILPEKFFPIFYLMAFT